MYDGFGLPPHMLTQRPPPKEEPPWTEDEDNKLVELKTAGNDYNQIAVSLPGRTPLSCSNRMSTLQKYGKIASAPPQTTNFWTKERDNEVIRRTLRGESSHMIAKELGGQSQPSYGKRISRLRSEGKLVEYVWSAQSDDDIRSPALAGGVSGENLQRLSDATDQPEEEVLDRFEFLKSLTPVGSEKFIQLQCNDPSEAQSQYRRYRKRRARAEEKDRQREPVQDGHHSAAEINSE
jgi:hypothetical protein